MKLTIEQVEARLTAAWSKQALLVSYRLPGNRYGYIATDHEEHWLPLRTSWEGRHQVFEPVSGAWPDIPAPDPWVEAVAVAVDLARVYFVEQGTRQP